MVTHVQIYLVLLAFSIILFALLILNMKNNNHLFNPWFIAIGFLLIYFVHQKFKIKA